MRDPKIILEGNILESTGRPEFDEALKRAVGQSHDGEDGSIEFSYDIDDDDPVIFISPTPKEPLQEGGREELLTLAITGEQQIEMLQRFCEVVLAHTRRVRAS